MKTYQWVLQIGTAVGQVAYPIFEDLKFTNAKESGEEYFRLSLSSSLVFVGADFESIYGADIESKMTLSLAVSEDNKSVWSWKGKFYKTDCVFNIDNQTCEVTPTTIDMYEDLLAGIEKEYDLYKLKPNLESVKYDKRSMLQVYIAGESKITCMFQGLSWEQDCDSEDDDTALQKTYHFGQMYDKVVISFSSDSVASVPGIMVGNYCHNELAESYDYEYTQGEWTLHIYRTSSTSHPTYLLTDSTGKRWIRNTLWSDERAFNGSAELVPVTATGASGTITIDLIVRVIYARFLCDVESFTSGGVTYTCGKLPVDDMGGDIRNFNYALKYGWETDIMLYSALTTTPTNYYYNDGYYYGTPPPSLGSFVPVAQSFWTRVSWWFATDAHYLDLDNDSRVEVTLRDAYPLWSAINALCAEITKDSDFPIVFKGTTDFSYFLYGAYFSVLDRYRLYITQKTNVLNAMYTQAAQKAPTTLRKILDMLRDCFQCYWWLERAGGENRLRIEQKQYFVNGGTYEGSPSVGLDLTSIECLPIGKSWAYGANEVSYDKDDMPEQYEFDWSDDVSSYFIGNPIEIRSVFVKAGDIESVTVNEFNSDLDYMLFNRNKVSEDGFAMLACSDISGSMKVRYTTSGNFTYQNGDLSFTQMVQWYKWSMPAELIKVNGVNDVASAVERRKEQTVDCPFDSELDVQKLVRTEIGDGAVESVEYDVDNLICTLKLLHETK